jgi:hypothetical protein
MMHPAVGAAVAYVVGSIPSAYIAGRLAGVDLREHGSGNLGATNVTRVLGWKVGLPVYLVDTLKGAIPVLLLPAWLGVGNSRWWALAYGAAAIVGHVRPVFLLGRGGGKGVATAAAEEEHRRRRLLRARAVRDARRAGGVRGCSHRDGVRLAGLAPRGDGAARRAAVHPGGALPGVRRERRDRAVRLVDASRQRRTAPTG